MPRRQNPSASNNKPVQRRQNQSSSPGKNKNKDAHDDTGMSSARTHNGVTTSLDSIQIQPRTPRTPRPHREWPNNGDSPAASSMDEVELSLLNEDERARAAREDGFGDLGDEKPKAGTISMEDKKAMALLSILCELSFYVVECLPRHSSLPRECVCRSYPGSSGESVAISLRVCRAKRDMFCR